MVNYYVIMAHIKGKESEYSSVLGNVAARDSLEAMRFAQENFRREHNLPPNIHVDTKKLYENSDPRKVDDFYDLLMEKIREEKDAG